MNTDSKIKKYDIRLSEEDIQKIIANRANSNIPGANVKPDDVKLIVETETAGYYLFERKKTVFKGAIVHIELDKEE